MTERYIALTVTLDKLTHELDVQDIIAAIKMIKGVQGATGIVVDSINAHWAREQARLELLDKLIEMARET